VEKDSSQLNMLNCFILAWGGGSFD